VYLDGPAALARLEATDPKHYPLVQRILASADELCAPRQPTVQYVAPSLPGEPACDGMMLLTSYPPKRVVRFTLDEVRYVALVVLTKDQPRLIPAR